MKKPTLTIWAGLLVLLTLSSNLVAAGPKPGELKWTFFTKGHVAATPTVADDGTVYAGTVDDGSDDTTSTSKYKNSFLWAITPRQGKEKWVRLLLAASQQSSPTLSRDEKIVYVTANRIKRGSSETGTAEISAGVLAAFDTDKKGDNAENFNNGTPVVQAHAAFGSLKMELTTKNIFVNAVQATSYNVVKPCLYVFDQDGLLMQNETFSSFFSLKNEWNWKRSLSRELVLNGRGGVVNVMQAYNMLGYAIGNSWRAATDTQAQFWISRPLALSLSGGEMPQPAIDVRRQRIYVVDSQKGLLAYQATDFSSYDKTPIWSYNPSNVGINISLAAPTVAEKSTAIGGKGNLYLSGADGCLYVVEPDGTSGRSISPGIPVSDFALVTRPVVDNKNNILYVVDANYTLYALDLNSKGQGQSSVLWHANDVAIIAPALLPDFSVVVSSANHNTVRAYVGGR